jgi:hypothetical protein
MNIRILTIATAVAITAIGFTAPASAMTLGSAGQAIAQSVDSPVLEVGKKHGGKKWGGKKWGGKHGKWHGGGHKWHGKKWGGKHYGYYPSYHGHYNHGGCFQQVHMLIGGHYVWQTVNICN